MTDTIERSSENITLRPRRTLNRLALGLAGVACGALGQFFFSREALWDGLLCYAIAVILFNLALVKRFFTRPPAPDVPHTLGIQSNWRLYVGVWLIILAMGISFFAFNFFSNSEALLIAWWVYLVSLVMLLSAAVVLNKSDTWRRQMRYLLPNSGVALSLLAIIGLALFMRLYHFGQQPFGIWFDEAEAGLQARQMLENPTYRPIFYILINVTGHFLALYALALRWLGDTIYSLRLVSVLFGLGGVLAAYLFGRELRGPRFGLAMAFCMAVARWPVNFSRIAMTGIDTPFFELLSLFFLVRLFRRGRLRDAIAAGFALGFGLVFYTAFRLYILALLTFAVVFVCLWLIGAIRPAFQARLRQWGWPVVSLQGQAGWAHLGRLTLLLTTTWLVVMPVAKFALDNPTAFGYRTQEISILTRRDQADLSQALLSNTSKHLLMFNYHGDNNGRHNLPGEPMLDPVMGLLAVLGLGLALARPHRPANTFFLILFPVALIGGIFSVDFEAPQSLRSIGVIPVVIYFIVLASAALVREAEATLTSLPRRWLVAPAAAVAGFMFIYNAYLYFERQAHDFASWNAFSTAETIIGQKMAELGPTYLYFLSPVLTNHPTTRFIAPEVEYQFSLQLMDALPIREPPVRPVALFLHPDDVSIFDKAQQLYSNATFETILGQAEVDTGPPILHFVDLQPADLASQQGLDLTYRRANPADQTGTPPDDIAQYQPLHRDRVFDIKLSWPDDRPTVLDESNAAGVEFMAEWNGILYIPRYGPYSFRLVTPGSGWLEIDGNVIFDGQGQQLTGLRLAQGNHTLRLQAEVAPGELALYWQPPGRHETLVPQWALYQPSVANHGLLGTYYPNDRWEGQPAFQRIDTFLDTYFHIPPLQRPYTVEWAGTLVVPQDGLYRLGLRAVGEARLEIDGELKVVANTPNQLTETVVMLDIGLHEIKVRFKDHMDRSQIHLYWMPPGGQFEAIPSQNLWPPMGSFPPKVKPSSDIQTAPLSLTWLTSWGGPGPEPGQFYEPRDVTVLPNGNIAVADTINRRVQIFNPQGEVSQILTGDDHPFKEPLALDTNGQGDLLILDSTLQWVYRYDWAGNLIDRFGGPDSHLFHPRGLTVLDDDRVVLADTGNGRLAFFSADGTQAGSIGAQGSGPGQFNEPTDVLAAPQETYYVVEATGNRIQQVSAEGTSVSEWPIAPAYALNGPHLAFGPDHSIFVTESQSRSLYRYALDGTLLSQWQTIGPAKFAAPVGIYYDDDTHKLYVTDIYTHQVHIFAVETQS